jgi:hypothetical protein
MRAISFEFSKHGFGQLNARDPCPLQRRARLYPAMVAPRVLSRIGDEEERVADKHAARRIARNAWLFDNRLRNRL